MEKSDIQRLIRKYLSGECSPEERELISRWYADELHTREEEVKIEDPQKIKREIWQKVIRNRPELKERKRRRKFWIPAAAVILIGFLITYQLHRMSRPDSDPRELVDEELKVVPGGNEALLTLENGKQYFLSDEAEGILDEDRNWIIRKPKEGLISFESQNPAASLNLLTNRIETPKGGMYQLVLPDGSKAWLNSASSISFPSNFSQKERRISVKGEVYLEVEKDSARPFRVETPYQKIEVLGTKFNINAYEDEPYTRTSLLEGSVKVHGAEKEAVLQPGLEMRTSKEGEDKVDEADLEAILAWKEGLFQFDRVELDVLMRQLGRWYDVEIEYLGAYPQDEFVGKIERSEDIHNILDILQAGEVNVTLKGRKLQVGK
ncbi:MAG TPA: FecR domain-containing protein [Sphingobacterium sp.]|nr:FecR domain-containing protein [Sphingobacterium sp.]